MKRTFIAIRVAPLLNLVGFVELMKVRMLGEINWANTESWHITLVFTGSLSDSSISDVAIGLEKIASEQGLFNLFLSGFGVFGRHLNPKVLWAGILFSPQLVLLQQAVAELIVSLGIETDSRPYYPHVTLGRIKRLDKYEELIGLIHQKEKFSWGKIAVESVVFYESVLSSNGPYYHVMKEFKLSGTKP
jgi:2'-5' RNA ligase